MLTLIFNNLRLFFNDKKAVILTFALPIGLTSLFMMIFGGTSGGGDRGMSKFEIGVADMVQNKSSEQTVVNLDTSKSYTVTPVKDSTELVDMVFKGKLDAGVIIFANKGSNQNQFILVLDGAKQVENNMLKPSLGFQLMGDNGGMKDVIFKKIKEDFPDFDDSDKVAFDKNFTGMESMDFSKMTESGLKTRVLKPESGINPGAIQAISGNALMTLLFSVAGMGAGIIEEKEKGTLRRILLSPIRPLDFMFAKFFSSIIVACMQLTATLLFSWLVFDFPIFARPVELALLVVFTAATCAAFGILLAGIAE